MRKDNSTLLRKLKQYSALAGPAIAIAGAANAQAVYTDVDPDVVFADSTAGDGGFQTFLDLDNDGVNDFTLFVFNSTSLTNGNKVNLVLAGPYSVNGNGIMGYELPNSTNPSFYYPSALNANAPIDNNGNFWTGSLYGTLVWYYPPAGGGSGTFGQWHNVTDKYMGVHFLAGDGNTHYGWIRMDVGFAPPVITIKDWAFDSNADEGINAGEGTPLGVAVANNNAEFGIFGFEGVANIMIKDGKYDNALITVTNTMGQKVIEQKATDKLTRIDLNQFGQGVYVVSIQRGSEQFSKKISFR